MAVYVVGDFLRETRLRKGYTQPANKKSRLKRKNFENFIQVEN